ncbi:Actin-related protein 9 [Platanthera guangdongensis]|uniref:Actin-related protein 9 n=1 Tax=Platanthera guangdongensis TaxID=2320717 RepID=A0ABR2LSA4_9ASPA
MVGAHESSLKPVGYLFYARSRTSSSVLQILGILDFSRDAWIHREDWIRSGIHVGSGRKYKDSYFLQAQAMCYINS